MKYVIEVKQLSKSYKNLIAVDNVALFMVFLVQMVQAKLLLLSVY